MQTLPPVLGQRPPDWWSRNWKWFVPLICVAGVLAIGGFVMLIMGFLKSSEAYVGAVARARGAPAVIDALGTPIREGYFATGEISMTGASGKAELAIPLAGPKAKATLYVLATKELGVWHYDGLVVQVEPRGERIDLSEKGANPSHGPTPVSRRDSF
jgi:hypothetical protein